jgi:hypothetical protein
MRNYGNPIIPIVAQYIMSNSTVSRRTATSHDVARN